MVALLVEAHDDPDDSVEEEPENLDMVALLVEGHEDTDGEELPPGSVFMLALPELVSMTDGDDEDD